VHFFCQGGNNKENLDFIREKGYQLQKGREIIGLPVVSLDTGDEIGVVDDILWSHRDMRICCLVVGDHCLPFAEISSIGTDAITVSGREVLQEDDVSLCEMREAFPRLRPDGREVLQEDGVSLCETREAFSLPKEDSGTPSETREPSPCLRSVNQTGGELVLSQDGNNLGTLKDVIFDADEGKLLGYELSTGVVGDLLSGRMIISPEMVLSWGKEAIITGFTGTDRGGQNAVSDMPW
jgi:uncharacterized protein YrrD